MAYSYKTQSNLGKGKTEYSRYYGGFRGVDFSNDHTQVNQSRLAYLVNMYKDYQSGQGEALETIVGFRQRANFTITPIVSSSGVCSSTPVTQTNKEVFGIFFFKCKENGEVVNKVLIHCGNKLFLWRDYPNTVNIPTSSTITMPEPTSTTVVGETAIKTFNLTLDFPCKAILSIIKASGENLISNTTYNSNTKQLTLTCSNVEVGEALIINYFESVSTSSDVLFSSMNSRQSSSFVFNNRLYILDGKNYLVFNGTTVSQVKTNAYIPTTYINIVPNGENADIGTEFEQRNMLTPKFKHTFIADGTTTEFYLNENDLDSIVSVKVYGQQTNDYTADLPNGKITFTTAPTAPQNTVFEVVDGENIYYEEGYAGIEITASKTYTSIDGVTENMSDISELISKCTLCTTFDSRVFCTGNPDYPNHVFFCGRNNTGYADPSYFGILNYMQDGVGHSPITGIMCVSNTLMILKADTQQDSSIYYHTGEMNSGAKKDILPRIYPAVQGLSGLGCLGACCNFLDDPIFISRLGVEGVSQLKIASERVNEHRSRLIDAKLVNTNLSKAKLEEWGGYLCVLTDGKIFLADSRQRYQDSTGAVEYEWYYLEEIGVWENQYREYKYSSALAEELQGATFTHEGQQFELELANNVYFPDEYEYRNLCGTVANTPNSDGESEVEIFNQVITAKIDGVDYPFEIDYVIYVEKDTSGEIIGKHAYLCESRGNYTGGIFKPAVVLHSMDSNLFFGCSNGVICSFNFDLRNENGEFEPSSYSFDNRTIFCGLATLMDNCQIPHLTKSTVKRSTVIKTKSFSNSAAKVKVRTNKKPYEQIARINSNLFSFNNVDFSDFSFITTDQSLFSIKEKEKKWIEKQYYIYSDEYLKPFSLYYIAFRYYVAGRYKN